MASDDLAHPEEGDIGSSGADNLHVEYFHRNVVPWLVGHLEMRSTGLQIFTAIQGGLAVAWATRPFWAFPVLGLASCLSFLLWDRRNRFLFTEMHQLGEQIVDRKVFGVGSDGLANAGVYRMSVGALEASGKWRPSASHTWAINVMVAISVSLWIGILINNWIG